MLGIASAATSVLIGPIAAGTERIRVGAGGIMLPNHAPLQIAEQFGTLERLFPGRIDSGVGRAPGTDGAIAAALREHLNTEVNRFSEDVEVLLGYFSAGATRSTGPGRVWGRVSCADTGPDRPSHNKVIHKLGEIFLFA